uniref:Exosome complex component RRP45 n=1 Tax=Syphacia muris TaxID=451379 RepID=A0A0N5ABA9_9BILA
MRTEPLSICEKNFISQSFAEGQIRIDGRTCDEYRDIKVIVGSEFGTCLTTVGKTKVFTQVSCNIIEPRSGPRGFMGAVEVQVDMSPMGSPAYEDGRLGSQGIELTRILETLIRDGGVIDLESLCLRADKQVWQIRVDVHILDSDGSLADCASISALTALAHFRRPDVTIETDSMIVHTSDQKMPIPLNVYHIPICITFGIAADG